MAKVSIALFEAHRQGAPIDVLADRLGLTDEFVAECIEAARLSLRVCSLVEELTLP